MLKVLTTKEANEWDEIVKSFSDYDAYYLSGYVKGFEIHGDGEGLLFYYSDDRGRGINVVMKRDIALDPKFQGKIQVGQLFDFATPYGYGGWLMEGDPGDRLFAEYSKWCGDNHVVSEFVRFHPVLDNYRFSEGFYDVIALGETVAIDTSDKEAIWANFSPKNRNVIRKAINNGIEIKKDRTDALFEAFKKIYDATMDKDSADIYYYFEPEFYKSIQGDLSENSTVFFAELNGKIIAASIMVFANGRMNYHLSGSLREYQNLAPSNLLLWKAAEWANDIGCKTMHLGGGVGSAEDGLFKFKRAFYRGDLCRYHIGEKIYDLNAYEQLLSLREEPVSGSFFPKYRS